MEVDWRSCFSMSDMPELEKFEKWLWNAMNRRGRELRCLEIGSFHGKTTAIMAQFGEVIAVDLWGNVESGLGNKENVGQMNFGHFIENMIRLGLIERVHPVCSTSKFLNFLPPLVLDVAFIDGDHSYEAVKLDIDRCERHVDEGGMIILHDVRRPGWGFPYPDGSPPDRSEQDPWGGVARACDELLETRRFKIYEHYLGIVALERS